MEEADLTELPSIVGADAVTRFTKFLEHLELYHRRDAPALVCDGGGDGPY